VIQILRFDIEPDYSSFRLSHFEVYKFRCVLQKYGKEAFSDFARVSVYAPLSIHPSSLVLAPGQSTR
jgi:hypothetical protein